MASKYREIARKILKKANKRTLHVREIAKLAIKRDLITDIDTEKLANKLSQSLNNDIRRKGRNKSDFGKVSNGKGGYKRGVYRLKNRRKTPKQKRASKIGGVSPIEETKLSTDRTFKGKAAELAVLSELLYREFNSGFMIVDKGLDLFAVKNGKTYYIQVKSSDPKGKGKFVVNIRKDRFKAVEKYNPFYIIVLRYSEGEKEVSDFLIFKNHDIDVYLKRNIIDRTKKNYTLKIEFEEEKGKAMLNGKESIHFRLNAFDLIK